MQQPNACHRHNAHSSHPFLSYLRTTGLVLASAAALSFFSSIAIAQPDTLPKKSSSLKIAPPLEVPKPIARKNANQGSSGKGVSESRTYKRVNISIEMTEYGPIVR